jgi:hypothetical protein
MMNEIQTIPSKVPCYLVKTGSGFFLIDTGDSSDCANPEKALGQAGVTPRNLKLVLLTHGDFDHVGKTAFLQFRFGICNRAYLGLVAGARVQHSCPFCCSRIILDDGSIYGDSIVKKRQTKRSLKPDCQEG